MSLWDDYTGSTANPINWFKNEDPSKSANRYLDQIPGIGKQYYNPFIEGGQEANGILKDQYGKLMNPSSFIDDIMKHYNLSEGAQYQQDKLSKGIGATAAAGGFAGTPEHQREYGEMSHKIMSEDMQQYLQNALGVYGKGLSGQENFYNKGYDASSALADLLGGSLGSQAGLAFQGTQQRNMNNQAFANALMKALSSGAGAYMGGA